MIWIIFPEICTPLIIVNAKPNFTIVIIQLRTLPLSKGINNNFMYIRKVEIKNIRSIANFKMEFQEGKEAGWHVLIGDNGSGKSTILQTIALGIMGSNDVLRLDPSWASWVKKGQANASISVTYRREDMIGLSEPSHSRNEKNIILKIEKIDEDYKHTISENWTEGNITHKGSRFYCGFGPFRRFIGGRDLEAGEEKMTPLTPIESLFKPEILLNASLAWIKDQHLRSLENRAGAASTINIVKNVLSSEGLLPNGIKIEDINADGVFLKTSDNVILQINEFSDGVKSTLALTLELLRLLLYKYGYLPVEQSIKQTGVISVPGIVLIDEIDVHLHPTWQTRIGQWFTRFFPKIQFIVTTHSPLICRASRIGSIWRLAVPDSGRESSQVTGDQLNQLIHGNVLDAYETQVFGENIERDQEDQTELEEYSYLSQMEVYNPTSLSTIQRNKLELLKKTYKTHAPFALKTY